MFWREVRTPVDRFVCSDIAPSHNFLQKKSQTTINVDHEDSGSR
jgi:hypothetical protein